MKAETFVLLVRYISKRDEAVVNRQHRIKAESEHEARRKVLESYLNQREQVLAIHAAQAAN